MEKAVAAQALATVTMPMITVPVMGANPRAPGPRAPAPKQPREGGAKILAPLSCALTLGALLDKSKYKKVSS